jgi:hypothetical protein
MLQLGQRTGVALDVLVHASRVLGVVVENSLNLLVREVREQALATVTSPNAS